MLTKKESLLPWKLTKGAPKRHSRLMTQIDDESNGSEGEEGSEDDELSFISKRIQAIKPCGKRKEASGGSNSKKDS